MGFNVRLNGMDETVEPATVIDLLRTRGIDPAARGVAVALNGKVVRRADWVTTEIKAGDAIEIVRPFSGG
jgi:sulfur carrier protein